MHEERLAAAMEREGLLSEHGMELDDLLRQHDAERQQLYSEVSQLKLEYCRAEASAAIMQPIMDIRTHLEGQVMRQVTENEELRRSLEMCHSELSVTQDEFNTLAVEFEWERREHLKLRQRCQHAAEARGQLHSISTGHAMNQCDSKAMGSLPLLPRTATGSATVSTCTPDQVDNWPDLPESLSADGLAWQADVQGPW